VAQAVSSINVARMIVMLIFILCFIFFSMIFLISE